MIINYGIFRMFIMYIPDIFCTLCQCDTVNGCECGNPVSGSLVRSLGPFSEFNPGN